ncbi:hypothetical protein BDV28DRAFT_149218 [Aspergillus coremiiformis]|uniref:Secreted protein CSS2 C-terminal domain-containing protein n=1 Tax=Aspergillus coremiiformis TaxID=138285 RepID=A0A5N6Z3J7_9EURO|nr:hypothetical protein BDV28DRAFT_149218 [Aspergillus coremiiformis]
MFFTQSLLIVLVCWHTTSALALSLPPQFKQKLWGNLHDPKEVDTKFTTRSLQKRAPVTVCPKKFIDTFPACNYNGEEAINAWIYPMARKIKDMSNQNKCDKICGSTDGFRWCYEASTEGKNCDTTADVVTIQGALKKAFAQRKYWVCQKECFRMSHGGTWRGTLSIGRNETWDENFYCGAGIRDLMFKFYGLGKCISGGNDDL